MGEPGDHISAGLAKSVFHLGFHRASSGRERPTQGAVPSKYLNLPSRYLNANERRLSGHAQQCLRLFAFSVSGRGFRGGRARRGHRRLRVFFAHGSPRWRRRWAHFSRSGSRGARGGPDGTGSRPRLACSPSVFGVFVGRCDLLAVVGALGSSFVDLCPWRPEWSTRWCPGLPSSFRRSTRSPSLVGPDVRPRLFMALVAASGSPLCRWQRPAASATRQPSSQPTLPPPPPDRHRRPLSPLRPEPTPGGQWYGTAVPPPGLHSPTARPVVGPPGPGNPTWISRPMLPSRCDRPDERDERRPFEHPRRRQMEFTSPPLGPAARPLPPAPLHRAGHPAPRPRRGRRGRKHGEFTFRTSISGGSGGSSHMRAGARGVAAAGTGITIKNRFVLPRARPPPLSPSDAG